MTDLPRVAILLSTYQGERFLAAQLDSIARQTHANWQVWASDDGSTDQTLAILQTYQLKWGADRLRIVHGPRQGFCQNFLSLIQQPLAADYFAFCDQDDLWHPDRLSRALIWLDEQPLDRAAMYCGRTRLIDEQDRVTGFSPLFSKPPAFENALVQSIAGGNTMTFNRTAYELLKQAGLVDVQTHDWWLYLLVTGSGGTVKYDPVPAVDYRQHGGNLVGSNNDWLARVERLKWLLQGRFQQWNQRNIRALETTSALENSQEEKFLIYRRMVASGGLKGLWALNRQQIYRQTGMGTIGLQLAMLLKKL